ncbi:hypothetical protein, partial [Enterococcus faecium]|uniref:hypothetical protein n=1 Tax=Enterococcus faecium TaxID=1352 RepID=UPI001E3D9B3A
GLPCLPVTQEIAGSIPVGTVVFGIQLLILKYVAVAQLVEQRIEATCFGRSLLSRATMEEERSG